VVLACGVVAACAYYNGLYNANRLAADAARAERQGRGGEARSLWAQAAVKAESVATRFPTSRHRDDALLLWGRALASTENCRRATRPLALAIDSSPDPKVVTEARLHLGRCQVQRGRPDSALMLLTPLLAAPQPAVATQARLWSGRAELNRGAYRAAIEHLSRVQPDSAVFDLASAYLALSAAPEAVAALRLAVRGPYDEARWRAALDSLSWQDRQAASDLALELVVEPRLSAGQRGRLLLDDGRRWAASGDPGLADERYRQATSVATDSVEGVAGAAYLAVAQLRRAPDLTALPELQKTLQVAQQRGGIAASIAGPVAPVLARAIWVEQDNEGPAADVRMFLVAEELRDSLEARGPALDMFLTLERTHPGSPLAPKALLAAVALDATLADSVHAILLDRYADSPYALALIGMAGDRFTALEDSLRIVLAEQRARFGRGGVELGEEERGAVRR
jgi:hypothetical protein